MPHNISTSYKETCRRLAGKSCAQLESGALLTWENLHRVTIGRELAVSARLWEGYYLINHNSWCKRVYQLFSESKISLVRKTGVYMRVPGRGGYWMGWMEDIEDKPPLFYNFTQSQHKSQLHLSYLFICPFKEFGFYTNRENVMYPCLFCFKELNYFSKDFITLLLVFFPLFYRETPPNAKMSFGFSWLLYSSLWVCLSLPMNTKGHGKMASYW